MGSGGHQDDDVLQADHTLKCFQHGRDDDMARLSAGAVAHRNGDGRPGAEQVTQRRTGDRFTHRPQDLLVLIRGGRRIRGFHDQCPVGRQVNVEAALPVGQ